MSASEDITRQILGNAPPLLQRERLSHRRRGMCPGRSLPRRMRRYRHGPPQVADSRAAPGGGVSRCCPTSPSTTSSCDRYAGIAHLLMFYGFSVLFIGTCLVFLEHDTPLHFYGTFYLVASLGIDLGGVAFIVGLVMFLARRLRGSAPRLLQAWWVAALAWLPGHRGDGIFPRSRSHCAGDACL